LEGFSKIETVKNPQINKFPQNADLAQAISLKIDLRKNQNL